LLTPARLSGRCRILGVSLLLPSLEIELLLEHLFDLVLLILVRPARAAEGQSDTDSDDHDQDDDDYQYRVEGHLQLPGLFVLLLGHLDREVRGRIVHPIVRHEMDPVAAHVGLLRREPEDVLVPLLTDIGEREVIGEREFVPVGI
jgi:hypothetical protein